MCNILRTLPNEQAKVARMNPISGFSLIGSVVLSAAALSKNSGPDRPVQNSTTQAPPAVQANTSTKKRGNFDSFV